MYKEEKMKMLKNIILFLLFIVSILFTACSGSLPGQYTEISDSVKIYPDYREVVLPCNIAPLNFSITADADDYITRIGTADDYFLCKGKKIQMNPEKWRCLLDANKGKDISYDIYINKEGKWYKYPSFTNRIAEEPVDEYLSYRLISPSYVVFEDLYLCQRNLTNFEEKDIYNNRTVSARTSFQCINCHSYQNYRTDNMQFHARQYYPGTIIVSEGKTKKLNIKTGNLISGGVYPAWHPTEKLIAYSVNNTGQFFHSKDVQKIEVQDSNSDLILYDVNTDEVMVIQNDTNSLETFPAWAPTGDMLYFASAYFPKTGAEAEREGQLGLNYQKIKYNIIRMSFDVQSRKFGAPDTVFNAALIDKSATLPRISPDGKYLLFTLGDYGTFHIWHTSSDLHLLDLETGEEHKLENVNSPNTESYHTWSSNGRWIVFSSRRDDGSYTRPYIAYFDTNGKAHRPFILPQEDPDFYAGFYKSYNIPEFTVEPVKIPVRTFEKALKEDAVKAVMKE